MADIRGAWGVDIGQFALKAVKLKWSDTTNQVMATAFDYIQYPKILSQPDAVPEEIIAGAMQTFLSRNDVKGDTVSIAVPGHSSLTRFIQLPPVESKKLGEIIKYEARQQIPFALEDVFWDYQPLGGGIEESGYLLDAEVGLFAMKREQVFNHLRPFATQKIEVELIQVAPIAIYNMLCFDEMGQRPGLPPADEQEHIIVLDMGCDNTTLMITNGKKIWTRNVPIGGNHFTRALTKEMKLSFAKAEHLKCNATKSPDPRAVFQALRPVFNDFVSEMQRSIGFFSSTNRSAKIGKVIGLGNGFKLAGLQKFLQQNLQYEVERPDTFKAMAGDAVVNSPLFADNVLSFAVPYGLALQGLKLSAIGTTLLPPEITRDRIIRKKKPWAVATAATLLCGFALATAGSAMSNSAVNTKDFAEAEKQAADFKADLASKKSAYDTQVGTFEATKARLSEYTEGCRNIDFLELFQAVNDCLPRDPGEPPEEIPQQQRISIKGFTQKRVADLTTEWWDKLSPNEQQQLTPVGATEPPTGPAGEGYVVTLHATHWHDHPDDPREQEDQYVFNFFIKELKKWQVSLPGGSGLRDVRRMGITHPVLRNDFANDTVIVNVDGARVNPKAAPKNLFNRGAQQGGLPMGPSGQPMGLGGFPMPPGLQNPNAPVAGNTATPGAVEEGIRRYKELNFTVEFAFKYVPEGLRELTEPSAGEAAPAAAETPAATPATPAVENS